MVNPKPISSLDFSCLQVGQRVRSLKTNAEGKIIQLEAMPDRFDRSVWIEWSNGSVTLTWHSWLTNVVLKTWFIYKASRTPIGPYTGPACEKAGVIPGRIYTDYIEAVMDSYKLGRVNPVGFLVEES